MHYLYIVLISCTFIINSNIIGTYNGQSLRSRAFAMENNGKLEKAREHHNTHTLTLNDDSTFTYKFDKNTFRSSISAVKLRNCTGTWYRIKDTLILDSKYKGSDFFIVQERTNHSLPQNVIQISISNQEIPYMWGRYANLWVNDRQIEQCRNNDTVYTKPHEVNSIRLSVFPINFDYEFKPKYEESNEFEILFRTELGEENYYFENWKLLIDGKKLVPIDESNGLVNGLKKQKGFFNKS